MRKSREVMRFQVGAAIAVYVFRGEAHNIISTKMNEGLTNYNKSEKYKVMEFRL